MLWFKACHIIAFVCWFAAIFYLPRLYVYHADTVDSISLIRFKLMEKRLYFGIMWPSAVLTTFFGFILISLNSSYYLHASWMHVKLFLVVCLWGYHLYCGYLRRQFLTSARHHSSFYYRVLNEVPTLFLVLIVIMVVVKPF